MVIKGDAIDEKDDDTPFETFETFQAGLLDKARSLLRLNVEWEDVKDDLWDVPISPNISRVRASLTA